MTMRLSELTKKINDFRREITETEEAGNDPHSLKEELDRMLTEHKKLTGAKEQSGGLLKG